MNNQPQYAEAVKEFNARLGDELSIKPGDIIEVISDDREFNDGWYMGKNLRAKLVGLYPKSFTRPIVAPNMGHDLHRQSSNDSTLLRSRSRNRQSLTSPLNSPVSSPTHHQGQFASTRSSVSSRVSSPTTAKYPSGANPVNGLINNSNNKFASVDESAENSENLNHRASHSSVIKTMSEIDQALEEFKPESKGNFATISILEWDSFDVADYFRSLDYYQEAQQFLNHKITGNILLELELAYLKELDIGPFGTRFEIFKIIESLKNKVNSGQPILESQKRISGTGIMMNDTKKAFSKSIQPVSSVHANNKSASIQEPAAPSSESFNAMPPPNDYAYSMDNPYLNLSTENFNAQQQQQQQQPFAPLQEDSYSLSSESVQESRSDSVQRSAEKLQSKGAVFSPLEGNINGNGNWKSNATSPVLNDERQFSPIRKAPLPPNGQTPSKKLSAPDMRSITSPSTPSNSNRNTLNKNFVPFSAGSRLPDSPITQLPEDEFGKMNLINESAELENNNEMFESSNHKKQVSSPKIRSASANEASITRSPVQIFTNAKRAVSSAIEMTRGSQTPPMDEAVSNSESSFKVNQVRNAQTSRVMKKTKKQTSAFQEGINRVTPEMAAKTSDYAGWMSKKSSSAVGPWKQRFFTLHGTRLSYFGSMKDTREKGLIDITAHRVLPARDDDKLVSLYAATTGQGRYCFKLMPPAPGSKKGLTFTQPKVHYFAVETREEMRSWMTALMKATIDLDDTIPTVSTCSTPTVSLQKAQELLYKARENAKAREEQLKAKGFLQTGVNPNAGASIPPPIGGEPKVSSPNLEISGAEGILGSVSDNGSPADSSSTNSGLVSNNSNSNTSNNTSNGGAINKIGDIGFTNGNGVITSPKSEDRKTFSRFKK